MITETGDLIAATGVVITDAGDRGQGRRVATRPAARQPTFPNPESTHCSLFFPWGPVVQRDPSNQFLAGSGAAECDSAGRREQYAAGAAIPSAIGLLAGPSTLTMS